MAYPTKYTRQYDYVSYQNANPSRPLPATSIHSDLNLAALSTSEIVNFLKTSLRDDGAIANGAVTVDQLDDSLKLLIGDATVLAEVIALEAAAQASATAAAASQAAASTSATTASTAASAASTSATNASNSATAAAASATVVAGNQFTFDTSTTMADPGGPGGLRLNNATVASATAIAFDNLSSASGNPDISAFIAQWGASSNSVRGQIQIRKIGAPATFAVFNITGAVTNNTTWLQVPVTYVAGSGSFSAADSLSVQFARSGDAGSMTGPGASVDGEVAVYNGTGGTAVKRATGSGLAKLTSGVLSVATAGTDYLAPAAIGATVQAFDAQLFSNIPQNSQSAAYTLVAADAQKHVLHPAADNNARTFTIPANGTIAFPVGTCLTFINDINTVTIAITSDTMVQAGTGATGSRSLAANSMATAVKITSTKWMISGAGLT